MSLFSIPLAFSMVASPGPDLGSVKVTAAGDKPSAAGPADYFSGRVRIDAPFQAEPPARVGGATVSFEPGARTAWHTHPLGQTLIVTTGAGWVQEWGKPAQALKPGDIVWIPPGVKHWHGARAEVAMSHIAIAESVDGSPVTWMEQVSEQQYGQVTH
ncbi:MAG TPA: cupin domain-containing protein [Stenotrophomonas sp.]|nr:cupin domain-containing protein [Stenotrophomonas sp.]